MIDITDIATLLHVDEKLRAHGSRFPNMIRAVTAKLDEYEAQHAGPTEESEPVELKDTGPGDEQVRRDV